jgi:hypothetical protein
MRIRDLLEARRNPHLNPRVDPIDTFSMYANKPNMFVTFTQLPKVGINPQSNYNTPIGVYSYPLKYVLERAYQKGTLFGAAPFASDAKYVHLFQQTSRNILDVSQYGKSQFEVDIRKLKNYFNHDWSVSNFISDTTTRHREIGSEMGGGFSYGRSLWYLIYDLVGRYKSGGRPTIEATKILFRVLGYDAVYDMDGKGIIHVNEPTQAVHFNIQTLRVVESFSNKEMGQDRIQARREMLNVSQIKREFDSVYEWYISSDYDVLDAGYDIRKGGSDVDKFMVAYQHYVRFLDRVYQVIDKKVDDLHYLTKDDVYDVLKNPMGAISSTYSELSKFLKGNLALRWLSSVNDSIGEWVYRDSNASDIVGSLEVAVAGLKRMESQQRVRESVIQFINRR